MRQVHSLFIKLYICLVWFSRNIFNNKNLQGNKRILLSFKNLDAIDKFLMKHKLHVENKKCRNSEYT